MYVHACMGTDIIYYTVSNSEQIIRA